MYLLALDIQVLVNDRKERCEVWDRLILGHVVVDTQTATHIDDAERESERLKLLYDGVGLVAHILEDVQLADLRTDVDMDADDVDILERADQIDVVENLLVRDTELTVGLTCIDAAVGLGVDIGVDTQTYVGLLAHLASQRIHHLELLDRLAVDCQNLLLQSIADLLVALTHACIYHRLGVEARLDGFAYLVAAGAIDADAVLADDREQVVVVVGLDGVVNLVVVFV